MKSMSDLTMKLTKEFVNAARKYQQTSEYTSRICKKFGFPESTISDYLTMRQKLEYANDVELFCIAFIILGPEKIEEYYTETQIQRYSSFKFKAESFDTLRLPMIQISDDQWIGSIDAKQLVAMGDAQVINYNDDTQRTLERIVMNGIEMWRIFVNDTAVREIMNSYKNGDYVPNTITLNILDDNADINYNEGTHELVLTNIKKLDIIDGFHRYLALSKIIHENKNFNYNMELRIVNFSEMKARQFIWQEDQKTQMKKLDTYSYNQTTSPSKIVRRLNRMDDRNVFGGKISNNDSIINESMLILAIDQIYMSGIAPAEQMKHVNQIVGELQNKLETITDQDPNLLVNRWDRDFIIAAIYAFKNYEGDEADLLMRINQLYNNKGNQHFYMYRKKNLKIDTELLANTWKGGEV